MKNKTSSFIIHSVKINKNERRHKKMYNRYFSFEINTTTRTMLKRAERLKEWLIDNDYKIETSGCFNCVHFEIYIESHERFLKANRAIDDIIYFDAI